MTYNKHINSTIQGEIMGKTVIKHEDVETLWDMVHETDMECRHDETDHIDKDSFIEIVGEVFGIALPEEKEQ
jgi:hypothetical protein